MSVLARACGALHPFTASARPVVQQPLVASRFSSAFCSVRSSIQHERSSTVRWITEKRNAVCHAFDKDGKGPNRQQASMQFNPAYAAIFGGFAALFLFRNPYIFAALTILTIIPQNSAVTSLNSLVLIFYDSGLFMNFAEAVYCVRLISWLSIACTLISFAIFA